jgi:cell division protein FtsL
MKYGVLIFALIILAFLVMDFNARQADLYQLIAEREKVTGQLIEREQTRDALITQIAYATSPAAVKEWAYENHMAQPGDQIVVPIQVSPVTPTPTVTPMVQATQMSNVDRWMLLFFGP